MHDDLKWKTNLEYLVKKASKRLFALKILRNYNAPMEDLKSFHTSVIRSTLEYCAHIWHGNLTHEQTRDIQDSKTSSSNNPSCTFIRGGFGGM